MSLRPVVLVAMLALGVSGCSSGGQARVAASGPSAEVAEIPASSTTMAAPAPEVATTTTTAPPVTATTVKKRVATTTTAAAAESVQQGQVAVTLVNNLPVALDVTVNGVSRRVAAGSRVGPVGIAPRADENDSVSAKTIDGQCGVGDAGPALQGSAKVEIDFNPDPSGQRCANGDPVPVFVVRR
jgi:hypothetical protein